MLEICNVTGGYRGAPVLQNVSLHASGGKVTVLAGPNGCGKTTLLKCIAGIHPVMSGDILLADESLIGLSPGLWARKIAWLPQSQSLPELTVERLVLQGRFPYLSYPRRYSREDRQIAREMMEKMELLPLAQRHMDTLSGGQRQKAFIAMVLTQNTPVILLDEPTVFLDIRHQIQLMEQVRSLAAEGKTVVMVLHDLSMALQFADNLVVMQEGRVVFQGAPEQVYTNGCLPAVFGVQVNRMETPQGWQYYYREKG